MGHDEQDPDRAAILARRRRFVALALSGLTSSACRHESPQVCLQPMPSDHQIDDAPADGTTADGTTADTSAPIVEDPGAPLTPAEPEQQPEQTGEPHEDEPAVGPKPRPQPCLKKRAPPRVCLLMSD